MKEIFWVALIGKAISICQLNSSAHVTEVQSALSGGALRQQWGRRCNWQGPCVYVRMCRYPLEGRCIPQWSYVICVCISLYYPRWELCKAPHQCQFFGSTGTGHKMAVQTTWDTNVCWMSNVKAHNNTPIAISDTMILQSHITILETRRQWGRWIIMRLGRRDDLHVENDGERSGCPRDIDQWLGRSNSDSIGRERVLNTTPLQ